MKIILSDVGVRSYKSHILILIEIIRQGMQMDAFKLFYNCSEDKVLFEEWHNIYSVLDIIIIIIILLLIILLSLLFIIILL
jgi:hypothetical protein